MHSFTLSTRHDLSPLERHLLWMAAPDNDMPFILQRAEFCLFLVFFSSVLFVFFFSCFRPAMISGNEWEDKGKLIRFDFAFIV